MHPTKAWLLIGVLILALGVSIGAAFIWLTPSGLHVADGTIAPRAYLPMVAREDRWRPFSAASPWNTPIGTNPEIDPNSSSMIATLGASVTSGRFFINLDRWTVPVYKVYAETPTYNVPCVHPVKKCWPPFGPNVPIPDGAIPDPSADGEMVTVDLSRNLSWDMYAAQKVGSGWEVEWGYVFDLTGTGVQPDGIGSVRGSGFPLLAGLIRWDEIRGGQIDHALVVSYDYPRSGVYVYPASATDGSGGPNAIPEGGRIQLDPTLNLDSLGLSPAGKTIARALQEYGAYVGDKSNGIALWAEGLYGHPGLTWNGVLTEDAVATIPWQSFRVLKMPPLKQ